MAANCKCYKTTVPGANIGKLKLGCPVHGNEAVERRAKQAALWKQAENNMPHRVKYHTTNVVWMCENQHPTVPEYILGAARKKLVHVNGKLCRIETVRTGYKYGQQSLLARLLGYWNASRRTGKRKPHTNRIYDAAVNGSVPHDLEKQKLLEKLAGPDGNEIAWVMITNLGIAHWYRRK